MKLKKMKFLSRIISVMQPSTLSQLHRSVFTQIESINFRFRRLFKKEKNLAQVDITMDHNPLSQGVSTQLQNLSPGSPQSITFNKPKLFSMQICFGIPVLNQPSALKLNYISVDVIFVTVTFKIKLTSAFSLTNPYYN